MQDFGKVLMIFGAFLGKHPGDVLIQKKNFTLYFPLATSLIVSVIFSFIFWLWPRR